MKITKDNYHEVSPAQVVEAMEAGEVQVPLTAFSITALLQIIAHIVEAASKRPRVRERIEALERIAQLHSAAIEQLLRNH